MDDEDTEFEIASHFVFSPTPILCAKVDQNPPPPLGGDTLTVLTEKLRQQLVDEFGKTSLSGKYPGGKIIRGPDGLAEIWLRPDAKPVSVPPYRMGDRAKILSDLVGFFLALFFRVYLPFFRSFGFDFSRGLKGFTPHKL